MVKRRTKNRSRASNRAPRRSPEQKTGRISQGSYVEVFPFSLQIGNTVTLTKSQLHGLPTAHPFRVRRIEVHADQPYVPAPASDQIPAYFCPGGMQVELTDSGSATTVIATSGSHIVPSGGRRVSVRQPRQSDWVSSVVPDTYVFGVLSAVCTGAPGNAVNAFLRGFVYVDVEFGTEFSAPTCPASLLEA